MNICFVFTRNGYAKYNVCGVERIQTEADYVIFIIPAEKIGQPDLDILLNIEQRIPNVSKGTHSVVNRLLNRLGAEHNIPDCPRDLIEYYHHRGPVDRFLVFSDLRIIENDLDQVESYFGRI